MSRLRAQSKLLILLVRLHITGNDFKPIQPTCTGVSVLLTVKAERPSLVALGSKVSMQAQHHTINNYQRALIFLFRQASRPSYHLEQKRQTGKQIYDKLGTDSRLRRHMAIPLLKKESVTKPFWDTKSLFPGGSYFWLRLSVSMQSLVVKRVRKRFNLIWQK